MNTASQVESAVLLMSDVHFGRKTRSYNPEVAARRLESAVHSLERIGDLLSGRYTLAELRVLLLGDLVEGLGIYHTQVHHLALTDPREQVNGLTDITVPLFRRLKGLFEVVVIEGVPGNHGRVSRKHAESTNWDLSYYDLLEARLQGAIPVLYNKDSDPFIRKVDVRGHKYLIYHGAGIPMYRRIPWYGLEERAKSWHITGLGPFEKLITGHFHVCGEFPAAANLDLMTSGTMLTDDEWALQELGREGDPRWHFFGVSDRFSNTWSYQLRLAEG